MNTTRPRVLDAYLIASTALCGALVMVVEVLGSRVIGPFFGVSLFVWTALITVTLLSLSLGYAIGGMLADRKPNPEWLYGIIIAAGILVALVPLIKGPIISACLPLGLRAGALVSATLLFAPALFLLGCVSPYVVRIATHEWSQLGRTVGILYAVSTAGSFAGTALTGFFIIAYIGITNAFFLCGGLLCLLGAGYFALFSRRPLVLAVIAPFAFPLLLDRPLPSVRLTDGTKATLIDFADSFYGSVKVVEYRGTDGATREMMIDGLIQGGIDLSTGQSIYEYSYLMENLPLAVKPDIQSALFVGLGPAAVVRGFQGRGIRTDVVDIDPMVVKMAQKYFHFVPDQPVIISDGRYILGQDGPRYDSILMDVFNGDITPGHILSQEALSGVKARLNPDGVFAMNLIGSLTPGSRAIPAIINTVRTQFSDVALFPVFPLDNKNDMSSGAGGNFILVARNGSVAGALELRHIEGVHRFAAEGVARALQQGGTPGKMQDDLILTDNFNPLDVLDVELHEGIRNNVLNSTPAAILLHG